MSFSGSKWFNPAQVFAQFTTSGDKEANHVSKNVDEAEKNPEHTSNNREIQITESAEVSLEPDRAKISIICANTKVIN